MPKDKIYLHQDQGNQGDLEDPILKHGRKDHLLVSDKKSKQNKRGVLRVTGDEPPAVYSFLKKKFIHIRESERDNV